MQTQVLILCVLTVSVGRGNNNLASVIIENSLAPIGHLVMILRLAAYHVDSLAGKGQS